MSPVKTRLLFIVVLLCLFSVDAFRYLRYRWTLQAQDCFPISNFNIVTEHCYENEKILGTQTRCVCNHTTNELMMVTLSWTVNATGGYENFTDTVTDRFFLGACYPSPGGRERVIYLADPENSCGPSIKDVVNNGKPLDPASPWRTDSPAWSSDEASETTTTTTVGVMILCIILNF